ncbi:MAG: hypothetical protein GY755_19465 [Chloroflexi bacterium]|nr:hypothetical protein [Chloroflexota bacterium]
MKTKYNVKRGLLVGILTVFLGTFLVLFPTAYVAFQVFTSKHVISYLIILVAPIYFFISHIIPYSLAGGVIGYLQKKNINISLIVFFFISLFASAFSEILLALATTYDIRAISTYSAKDYYWIMAFELFYIIPFFFLINKFFKK